MGRRANTDPGVDKSISIPLSLLQQVDQLLEDPVTQKTEYGAYSRLITQLLQQWVRERQRNSVTY